MPAIFFGHGNPMNALTRNAWTEGWATVQGDPEADGRPLLYVIALQTDGERASFPVDGFDGGSVSMLTVRIG
jgi:aromatic ring-opening dioxygenase catalytic subunit (LigB family)